MLFRSLVTLITMPNQLTNLKWSARPGDHGSLPSINGFGKGPQKSIRKDGRQNCWKSVAVAWLWEFLLLSRRPIKLEFSMFIFFTEKIDLFGRDIWSIVVTPRDFWWSSVLLHCFACRSGSLFNCSVLPEDIVGMQERVAILVLRCYDYCCTSCQNVLDSTQCMVNNL